MKDAIQDSINPKEINKIQTRKFAWTCLIVAILLEVFGVAMLNAIPIWLEPFGINGSVLVGSVEVSIKMIAKVIMLSMIAISYYCMSLALRKIALGVAYSVWEIVGMIGILFISFLFFPPNLTVKEYIGIAVGFVGIICVIAGEEH